MCLYKPQFLIDVTRKADLLLVTNSLQHNIDQAVCIMSKSIIISGLRLFVCLSVCVFAFHAFKFCHFLTIDLVTMTLSQLQHHINTNHVYKYHQYPIMVYDIEIKQAILKTCIFDLTFDLVTLGVNFLIPLICIMCISIINIQSLVHDIKSKQVLITKLHIWSWPLTLTLGQLQHLIDSNHICKCHWYSIIGSWYIVETTYLQIAYLTLTFDLVTLTLGQLQHQYQYIKQF